MNLLIVPFPYDIEGSCFAAGQDIRDEGRDKDTIRSGFFRVRQRWLSRLKTSFPKFLQRLIESASTSVGRIDGIVLP